MKTITLKYSKVETEKLIKEFARQNGIVVEAGLTKEDTKKRKTDRKKIEKEDEGLLKLMNEVDYTKTVSRSTIIKKLT